MVWKSLFKRNYRKTFSTTAPSFAARISRVVAVVEAPGDKSGNVQKLGKAKLTYP